MSLAIFFAIGRFLFILMHSRAESIVLFDYLAIITFIICAILVGYIRIAVLKAVLAIIVYVFPVFLSKYIENINNPYQIGIVEFVTTLLVGIVFGLIVLARSFSVFDSQILDEDRSKDFILQASKEIEFLAERAIQVILVFGTVIAISMSILWSGAVWRAVPVEGWEEYLISLALAKSLAVTFITVSVAIILWILYPLYRNYTQIKFWLDKC